MEIVNNNIGENKKVSDSVDVSKKIRSFTAILTSFTILIVFLVCIIVYQVIEIEKKRKVMEETAKEIEILKEEIDVNEVELESWNDEWKILKRARELDIYTGSEDE